MIQSNRKQREIARRERQILDVAREILLDSGYLGLQMDKIAQRMEYSKGTIYQHFPNKEEIILALVNLALEKRVELFSFAATLRDRSRERVACIGAAAEVFAETYAHFFQVEQMVRVASIWEKTSEKGRLQMHACHSHCMGVVSGLVRDAVAHGDLKLPEGHSCEELVFGLWSMNSGGMSLIADGDSLLQVGIPNGLQALRRNQNLLLDGYGWRPLSGEVDFLAMMDTVKHEIQRKAESKP